MTILTLAALAAMPRTIVRFSRRMPVAMIAVFQEGASKLIRELPDPLLYRNSVKGCTCRGQTVEGQFIKFVIPKRGFIARGICFAPANSSSSPAKNAGSE